MITDIQLKPKTIRRLLQKEYFLLMNLIQTEYTERKESDRDFAVYASAKLHIDGLNHKHVEKARTTLEIPSTQVARKVSPQRELQLASIASLELRVSELERVLSAFKQLFPNIRV